MDGFAREPGAFLNDFHVPDCVYLVGGSIPQGGIAQDKRVVVKKAGWAYHPPVFYPKILIKFRQLCTKQMYFILFSLGIDFKARKQKKNKEEQAPFSHLIQPSRLKVQSLNKGSIRM